MSDDIPNLAASKITSEQLALARGGTGADLTATGPGALVQTSSGATASVETLDEARGGTGQTSYTKGDVIAASAATTLVKVGVGTDGQILSADSGQSSGLAWIDYDDEKVRVTSDDTTADYLYNKLAAGSGITLTETNGGGDEDVTIAIDDANIPYTPADNTDWDSDTDPGDVDDALDQLASRVDTLEGQVSYCDQSGGTSDTYSTLSGTIDGSNTIFTVSQGSYTSGTLRVWLNGQLQTEGTAEDYVENAPASGTFDFNTAPVSGDEITVRLDPCTMGRWSGGTRDVAIRYDDGSSADENTKTTVKNVTGASLDMMVMVEMN